MHLAVVSPISPAQPASSASSRFELFESLRSHGVTHKRFYFGELASAEDVSIGTYYTQGNPRNFIQSKKLLEEIRKAHKQQPFSAIWVTLPPIMAALFCRTVKRKLHLPLIVDVRDPGISSVVLVHSKNHPIFHIAKKLEESIYQVADLVCTTTPELSTFLSDTFNVSKEKVMVVANGSLTKTKRQHTLDDKEKFSIVYAGTFAPYQIIEPFIRAVSSLSESQKQRVQIDLYGYTEKGDNLDVLIEKFGLKTCITLHGKITRSEVTKKIANAHAILVPIDGLSNPELYAYAIPLKYYEALSQSTPVLLYGGTSASIAQLERDGAGMHISLADNFSDRFDDFLQHYPRLAEQAYQATHLRETEAVLLLKRIQTLCE